MNLAQQIIERSLYEALRLGLVQYGYTPDISTFPETAAGYESYLEALKTIEAQKGFVVELFGTSGIHSKGELRVPRIVMDWVGFFDGEYGFSPSPVFSMGVVEDEEEEEEEVLFETVYDVSTQSGMVGIILVANTAEQERVLHSILRHQLPSRYFIPYYNIPGSFMIVQEAAVKSSSPRDQIKEWVYSYRIPDIHFIRKTGPSESAPISEIIINSEISSHLGIAHLDLHIT